MVWYLEVDAEHYRLFAFLIELVRHYLFFGEVIGLSVVLFLGIILRLRNIRLRICQQNTFQWRGIQMSYPREMGKVIRTVCEMKCEKVQYQGMGLESLRLTRQKQRQRMVQGRLLVIVRG